MTNTNWIADKQTRRNVQMHIIKRKCRLMEAVRCRQKRLNIYTTYKKDRYIGMYIHLWVYNNANRHKMKVKHTDTYVYTIPNDCMQKVHIKGWRENGIRRKNERQNVRALT